MMTDARTSEESEGPPKVKEYPVVSNPSAPRFIADTSIPVFLGVDFEVTFFTTSPDFAGKAIAVESNADGKTGRMRLPAPSSGLYMEAARARMNAQSTEQLAYGLMLALMRSEYTSPDEFRAIVDIGEAQLNRGDESEPSEAHPS